MVALVFGGLILLLLLFGPQLWTKAVLSKHAKDRSDCPGTGGELAEHLVAQYGLQGVAVERLDNDGDHYDPDARAIRLSPRVFDGRSVTAVTVAAHEFGHALQHHQNHAGLLRRGKMVRQSMWFDRIGGFILMTTPVLVFLPGLRWLGVVALITGIGMSLIRVAVHLVTLPVEVDASFNKALPILESNGYLPAEEMPAARSILRACAGTYLAASLWSLLNLVRWIRR